VQDLVSAIEFEGLRDVVLCAASYGGMAATWAADRIPEKVRLLIYIDALVPSQGESGLDLLPPSFGDTVRQSTDGWAAPPEGILPPASGIASQIRESYIARLRPQPVATFTEAVALTGGIDSVRRAFVRCTRTSFSGMDDPIAPMAERAKAQGWPYRELDLPHDPHLFDPAATAGVLEDLSRAVG
jgi:pimeloyl-ACP methyl ester carboxylesterase